MENLEKYLQWYYDLGVLTYGEIDDEEVLEALKTILQWKKDGLFISDKIPDNKYTVVEYWLYLSLLNPKCIDYGSSPRGAWLTEFGDELLEVLSMQMDKFLEEM